MDPDLKRYNNAPNMAPTPLGDDEAAGMTVGDTGTVQSPNNLLATALLGLGTTGLGALLGHMRGDAGEGAMQGMNQGALAGAKVFGHEAEKEAEAEKLAKAEQKRAAQKEEDFEEFKRRKDYERDNKPQGVKPVKNALGQVIDANTGDVIDDSKTPPKAAKGPAAPKPPDAIKGEDKLRTAWEKHDVTKRTNQVRASFAALNASKPDAPGDMSMIFQYMKMLDPGSTVREGEFANAQNTTGIDNKILNAYNRAREGTRLDDQQRAGFKAQARSLLDAQEEQQKGVDDYYEGLAKDRSLAPGKVVRRPAPAAASAPSVSEQQGPPDGVWARQQGDDVYHWNPKTKEYE